MNVYRPLTTLKDFLANGILYVYKILHLNYAIPKGYKLERPGGESEDLVRELGGINQMYEARFYPYCIIK